MLQYTALLFGVVAIAGQNTWVCPLFILVMGLSILHHGEKVAFKMLHHLAKIIGVASAYMAWQHALSLHMMIYWYCMIWTLYVWYSGKCHLPAPLHMAWQASMHVAVCVGMVALLRAS
jgi:hypothetical protein